MDGPLHADRGSLTVKTSIVVATVLLALSASVRALPAQAQGPRPEVTPSGGTTAMQFSVVPRPAPASGSIPDLRQEHASAGHKSPLLAGVLSYLLPGTGSFYAGNSRHGVRHLAIAAGAMTLAVSTGCGSDQGWGDFGCPNRGRGTLFLVGLAAYGVNAIWSIVTAVEDADAHNAPTGPGPQTGRVVGSLYVDPQIRILGTRSGTATKAALGLQVGRLAF